MESSFGLDEVERIEQQVLETEKLYGPVNHLERKYKAKLAFPYTQESYERFLILSNTTSGRFLLAGAISARLQSGDPDERPVHTVTLEHSFLMMKEELTQLTYFKIMQSNPSGFKDCGDTCPVENIS